MKEKKPGLYSKMIETWKLTKEYDVVTTIIY